MSDSQLSSSIPAGAEPVTADERDALLDALRRPDGTIEPPLQTAVAFVEAVDSGQGAGGAVDDLVTPETRGEWDLAQAADVLSDVGFASQVTYLSDEWAKVLLVRGVERAYRIPSSAAAHVPAYGLYLRRVGENWRVHRIALPDLSVEDLTS